MRAREGPERGRARPAAGNEGERETLIDQGGRGPRVMGSEEPGIIPEYFMQERQYLSEPGMAPYGTSKKKKKFTRLTPAGFRNRKSGFFQQQYPMRAQCTRLSQIQQYQ
jgi:hypothetical protein